MTEKYSFSEEIINLTIQMIERIKEGFNTLTELEERLLEMVKSNGGSKNPSFLLNVCKYFRQSINFEIGTIWDLAIKMGEKKRELPQFEKEEEKKITEVESMLLEMSPVEREKLRRELR